MRPKLPREAEGAGFEPATGCPVPVFKFENQLFRLIRPRANASVFMPFLQVILDSTRKYQSKAVRVCKGVFRKECRQIVGKLVPSSNFTRGNDAAGYPVT